MSKDRGDPVTVNGTSERAEQAYVYAYPSLMIYRALFGMFVAPQSPAFRCPLNELSNESNTLDATFKEVVTPNADTPYTLFGLDLRVEPMVLSVPAVEDRYYSFQLVDLFQHNFGYVGSRTTGSKAGDYLIAHDQWEGEEPPGIAGALRSETELVVGIGRTQLRGQDDLEALRAVQAGYRLTPLSAYLGASPPPPAPQPDWPVWDEQSATGHEFAEYASFLLRFCEPPDPADRAIRDEIAALADADSDAVAVGVATAKDKIAGRAQRIAEEVEGWQLTDAFGDRDFYAGDHLFRAASAQAGLFGNDKSEAFYPIARVDNNGALFDGSVRVYRWRLPERPPVNAFWSLTIYDTSYDGSAGYLVANPIDRYLVNDDTPGLEWNADGSLDVTISHGEPGADDPGVWLPAPDGPFYLVLRLYWPQQSLLDGDWAVPPVKRVA
jgi:hypothetical protein